MKLMSAVWVLSSRAAFWLLLSVIVVLNVPALSAPQARYIPPQAQVATPAAAAVKSETVYRDGPYGAGSRWKGQLDTEEPAGYDSPDHAGSKSPFLDNSPPKYSFGYSREPGPTLVRTPQYDEEQHSSYYDDLETDSRQYDAPAGRQYSRRRAYGGQKTEVRDPDYYSQRPKYDSHPSYGRSQDRDSQEQPYYSSPHDKDSASDEGQPSYRQPDPYQEGPDPYSYGSPDEEEEHMQAPYYGGDHQSDKEEHMSAPYYGGEQSRKEERIVDICLQRTTSPQQFPAGAPPYEETFRCCEAADSADTCSKNTTDPSPPYAPNRKARDEQHSFMDLVPSNPAATCRWAITEGASCPPFAFGRGSDCVAVQLNCTLSSAASQCGCPIKEGSLYFSTVAYLRPLESLTCLRQPGDSNHRPYWAQGAYLQGRIRSYATHEGGRSVEWKECSGSVEYSPLIPVGVDSPQEAFEGEYDEDDFWLRSGQMVVRLAVEEY